MMQNSLKKVLLVAYFFPPCTATGAMRPLNFSRHLAYYGWMPRILATDPLSVLPFHATNAKLLDVVPGDVHVDRVAHPDPRGRLLGLRDRVIQFLCKSRPVEQKERSGDAIARNGDVADSSRSWLLKMGKFVAEALLEHPDRQRFWYRPAIKSLAGLQLHERPDVVWATGGPWTGLLVGKRLAEQWGVPFIADFRDPWYSLSSSVLLRQRQKSLERSVFARAARVILNTEELRAHYGSCYPEFCDKLTTLTNGYPADLESFYKDIQGSENQTSPVSIEICHFGTVYWMRMPTTLFQAVEELVSEGKLAPSKLRLRFVGGWECIDDKCERLAKSLEKKGMLKREYPLPHSQCLKEMASADVLLILQPDAPWQIPAKLYEYIVAGRPVWVIGGEGATANLVQGNRLGTCCPNRIGDIKQTLTSLVSAGSALAAPDPSDTAQFNYRVLSERLAAVLDEVYAGGNR